ncbi:MAG: hypothetical protein ACFE8B_08945, partial [Candidatus Hermodarchaeota archaeon]
MSLENSFSLTPHEPNKSVSNKFLAVVRVCGAYVHWWPKYYDLAASLSEQYNDNAIMLFYDNIVHAGNYNIGEYWKHAAIHTRFIAYPGIPNNAEILLVFKLVGPKRDPPITSKIQVFVGGNLEVEEEWQGGEENVPVIFDKPLRPFYIDIIIRSVTATPLLFKSVDGYI